jgi:hypothetical protein
MNFFNSVFIENCRITVAKGTEKQIMFSLLFWEAVSNQRSLKFDKIPKKISIFFSNHNDIEEIVI